ncbi:MAG: membrane protein insertase YidC [Oscillospiraceae bacterium]|nr:membrane protein insertase YidC [Oscillospiraceae bacterium]
MGIIGAPLGVVMRLIFEMVQNYGFALLLFTVLTRLVLIPLAIKQTKGQAKMAMVSPQIQEINKKYAGNRQKINEEVMGLYSRIGYNPMSGCLPMVVQMVILFGVIDVIYRPITHMLNLPAAVITQANNIAETYGNLTGRMMQNPELATLGAISEGAVDFSAIPANYLNQMYDFLPQMNFFGINLMGTPSVDMLTGIFRDGFDPILLIPILSGLTSALLSLATIAQMSATQMPGQPNMKMMMYIMPVFSLTFTFMVPAGVGIYWIYSNVVGFIQAKVLKKFYDPKKMAEANKKLMEEEKERERLARIESKKKAKENGEAEDRENLSKKEQNSRKLAEARKRDAEKYGEEYSETDD